MDDAAVEASPREGEHPDLLVNHPAKLAYRSMSRNMRIYEPA